MALFENFPYTNFHELNLDWLLAAVKKLDGKVDEIARLEELFNVKIVNVLEKGMIAPYTYEADVRAKDLYDAYTSGKNLICVLSKEGMPAWKNYISCGYSASKVSTLYTIKFNFVPDVTYASGTDTLKISAGNEVTIASADPTDTITRSYTLIEVDHQTP